MAPTDLSKAQSKLDLLLDQAQISIDERNRVRSLDLVPSASSDKDLEKSLQNLAESIQDVQNNRGIISDNKKRYVIYLFKYILWLYTNLTFSLEKTSLINMLMNTVNF